MPAVVTSDSVHRYEEIFKRHAPLIYRTAYGITGSHEDAEDALQAIFLGLIRRDVPADLARNPEAYFHRAAVNKSLNLLRARRTDSQTTFDFHSSFSVNLHHTLIPVPRELKPGYDTVGAYLTQN